MTLLNKMTPIIFVRCLNYLFISYKGLLVGKLNRASWKALM